MPPATTPEKPVQPLLRKIYAALAVDLSLVSDTTLSKVYRFHEAQVLTYKGALEALKNAQIGGVDTKAAEVAKVDAEGAIVEFFASCLLDASEQQQFRDLHQDPDKLRDLGIAVKELFLDSAVRSLGPYDPPAPSIGPKGW